MQRTPVASYDSSCSIMKPLRNREVILFPDLGAEDSWMTKMQTLRKHGFDCSIASLLHLSSEAEVDDGLDLADFLLRWSVDDFSA